jgi:hypothetical protein
MQQFDQELQRQLQQRHLHILDVVETMNHSGN